MEKKINIFRRIVGDILIVLFALLAVDTVVVMINKINKVVLSDGYYKMLIFELIIFAIIIVFALDIRFSILSWTRNKAVHVLGWILRVIICIISALVIFFGVKVVIGGFINNAERAKYAVVLGMALEDGEPTNDLKLRLDTAAKYLSENKDAVLILTGGNAENGKTEADVMHDILASCGVPEESMYLEDKAVNTVENFTNTATMIGTDTPVVIISSNYHMDRATKLAKQAGFTDVMRLPAPATFITYGSNLMWEIVQNLSSLL